MRAQLAKSTQEYLSACATLGAACSGFVRLSFEGPAVEHALAILDSELESLATEEDTLRSTRFSLSTLRNRSATLAPINALPLEVLANIFDFLGPHCTRSRSFARIFTGVCTYWRKLSLDTPHLWSHIDVGPNVPCGLNDFLLERAKNSPLHVHVYEPKPDLFKDDNDMRRSLYVKHVLETLTPHVHRICTLHVSSDNWHRDFVDRVVNLWLDQGTSDLTRSLTVDQLSASNPLSFKSQDTDGAAKTLTNAEEVLLSLDTLRLNGARFSWESGAYRGLVDLQIGFSVHEFSSFSTSELACILTASPMMAVLKLENITVTRTDSWTQPAPIVLNCLEVLNLVEMSVESLQLLLPLIGLPRDCVELSVGIRVYDQIRNELEGFLDRASITTLYCADGKCGFQAWPSLLRSFPRLRTLVLDNFDISERIPSSGTSPVFSQSTPSRLPRVILLSCQLMLKGVDSLIAKLGVCDLRIEEYKTFDPDYKEHCIEIKTSLLEAYPGLQFWLGHGSITWRYHVPNYFQHSRTPDELLSLNVSRSD
ncbi:hypothetical protein FRC10_008294 [Ceratobasidium sp. 414]|nr:hypothetical protein FRC10_008294 [Ceratobasidium sp. 414]